MFAYTAYGLGIHSELALPELVAGAVGHDVRIGLGPVDGRPPGPPSPACFRATAAEVCLAYAGVGAFGVLGGREILVDPTPGVDEGVLRLYLLGAALGTLLHQRGALVLHASAVAVRGGAAAFLGSSGGGKSTTAAALHARGHPLIADDVVAVQEGAGPPEGWRGLVYPGFPQLKLLPEAALALGETPETLARLQPALDKRARPAHRGFPSQALPLRRVYVLAEGPDLAVEPLEPQEALMELVRHSYTIGLLQATAAAPAHFRQCGRLVRAAAVRRLRRPRCLTALARLARLVEDDVAAAEGGREPREERTTA